ncbi:isopentenyl-diphosphate delta-isomerase [compost metagenome]
MPGDLIEHEFDHIFVGLFDGQPQVNPEEVDGWAWIGIRQVADKVATNPDAFTVWFKEIIKNTHSDALEGWAKIASR